MVQHEATGTVSVLGLSGLEALLSTKSSLLVTDETGNLETLESARSHFTINFSIGYNGSEAVLVDAKVFQELIVPLQGLEVHEHGSRGVGAIGEEETAVKATSQRLETKVNQ